MLDFLKKEDGMILANSIVILATLVILGVSLITMILANSAFINKSVYSSKALYLAEAGIEKAVWELNQVDSTYDGELNNQELLSGAFDVIVEDIGSDSKNITGIGYAPNKPNAISTRTVRIRIDAESVESGAAFHYGVQVGDLGLTMSNNSKIYGNVYSNGNISGGNGSLISGDAYVSGSGGKIAGIGNSQRLNIGNDANAHTLQYLNITNDAYYFSNATLISCSVGGIQYPGSPLLDDADPPFAQESIDSWKNIAVSGGIIDGDYNIDLGQTESMGPTKINGNLVVSNLSTLNLTGVIWVTGNIEFSNNAIIELDPEYGSDSGMIIASSETDPLDYGKIEVTNNVNLQGSGEEGSYIMMFSENTSTSLLNPAIEAGNNSDAVVYYANNGIVEVNNNADLMSVYGRGLHLSNGAEIHYDIGLANANFSTGPGGAWVINSKSWERL